ncbi:MAG: efflux RND transporter periplasmic adaptor subunit, partial [Candidatus Binatia bacterium]
LEPARLRETVRAVGTLAANESVRVVPELSRRLVKVHAAEGAHVEKGDLLFELDDSDLRASLAELEVRRELAERTVARQRALMADDKKALSQQAYDQSLAELRGIEAEIATLKVTLAKTEVRAPFAGTTGLRHVSEGAWVTPETLLTTLQDTSRIKVDFTLPERYAPAIEVRQTFQFHATGRSETFAATIAAVEPVIDARTRSLLVRGLSDNPEGRLLPGAFVSVEVPLHAAGGGVMVPAEALVPSAEGQGVFVLDHGRAALRNVDVGIRTVESVQVLRGLEVGETVLTTNLLRLHPGARVELEEQSPDS